VVKLESTAQTIFSTSESHKVYPRSVSEAKAPAKHIIGPFLSRDFAKGQLIGIHAPAVHLLDQEAILMVVNLAQS